MGHWAGYGLLIAAMVAPAVLNTWRPGEIIGLVAVLALTGAVVVGVQAWQTVRTRAIELAALTSDEQAARLLGEALHRCGPHYLPEKSLREVWDTFVTLPSEAKRAMALAIVGFIGDSESYELVGAGPKLVSIARSFQTPVDAP
jgi:hypothetical protein